MLHPLFQPHPSLLLPITLTTRVVITVYLCCFSLILLFQHVCTQSLVLYTFCLKCNRWNAGVRSKEIWMRILNRLIICCYLGLISNLPESQLHKDGGIISSIHLFYKIVVRIKQNSGCASAFQICLLFLRVLFIIRCVHIIFCCKNRKNT